MKIKGRFLKNSKLILSKAKKIHKFLKKESQLLFWSHGCCNRIMLYSCSLIVFTVFCYLQFLNSPHYANFIKEYVSKPYSFNHFLSEYSSQNISESQIFLNQYFSPKSIYEEFLREHRIIVDGDKVLNSIVLTFMGSYIIPFILTILVIFYSFKVNLFDISFKNYRVITPKARSSKILFIIIWLSIGIVLNIIFMMYSLTEIWWLKIVQVPITQGFIFYVLVRTNCCGFKIVRKNVKLLAG